MKLAAIILTKNEESMIADCIDSLAFCDEVVVVDNGSTDKTIDIAKRMNAKVYQIVGERDFAQKRNFGLSKVKSTWVLYVDADERVDSELAQNIKEIVENGKSKMVGYRLQRKNYYFMKYEWPHIEKLERFFKRKSLQGWMGELHETPQVDGELGDIGGYLLHYTHRDLTSMLTKTIAWSKTEADLRYASGHPVMTWWRFPRIMLTAFYDSFIKQQGWKLGIAGMVESIYQAFSMFITYARLWEMQQETKRK